MRKYGLLLAAAVLILVVLFPLRSQQPAKPKPPPGLLSPATDGYCALPASPTDARDEPLAKLEELKKRLPGIMATWLNDEINDGKNYQPKLRVARRTSQTTAKVTFSLEYHDSESHKVQFTELVSIYLSFCDGLWTTTEVKETRNFARPVEAHRLMLAIDESGNK
jgi:hypothetical protein